MLRIVLFVCFLIFNFTSSSFGAVKYRVAVDLAYPPFAFTDESGTVTGFDVDVGRALCVELVVECEVVPMVFEEIIPALVEGKVDFAVAGMASTEERRKIINFTETYHQSTPTYLERVSLSHQRIDINNLEGKTIATQSGTSYEQYLSLAYGDGINLITYKDFDEIFTALSAGKCDLILVDSLSACYYMNRPEGANLEPVGIGSVKSDLLYLNSSIGVSKEHPDLPNALNKALQGIKANGEYAKINRKYFDLTIY